MSKNRRRNFAVCLKPRSKAKVALEASRGVKTITEIDQEGGVHPIQVRSGKKCCNNKLRAHLSCARTRAQAPICLFGASLSEIGLLKIELDWRKTSPG